MELILGTVKILSALNKEASQRENETSLNRKDKHRIMKSTLNYDDEELLILSVQERRSF